MEATTTRTGASLRHTFDAPPTAVRDHGRFLSVYLVPALVAVGAAMLAGAAYGRFLQAPEQLWSSAIHDRNAHYWLGLSLGLDLRHGDIGHVLRDLDGARVWPPLHGLLVGLIEAVAGPDYRLAVLPSLVGWFGAAVFAFLLARRAVPRGGNLAGLVAAIFILASPAHHAFSTDVMLESLGACLSLAVLYLYVVTVQDGSVGSGRCFGLALTALFLLKYNYWLLVVFALVAAELSSRFTVYRQMLRDMVREDDWRTWAVAQLRHPLNYAVAVLLVLVGIMICTGGVTLTLGQRPVSLHSPHNLVTVAYALLFLRLLPWWWRAGRQWVRGLDFRAQSLVFWHLWPVALWFLWPKRLSYCLWFLSPANAGEVPHHDLAGGLPYYWQCLTDDYHLGLWSLLCAVALGSVAVLSRRKLRPGGTVILWLLLIAALLTAHHPNRKSRFLHSWVAVGWVAAGVGLAQFGNIRLRGGWGRLAPGAAMATVIGLGLSHGAGMVQPGHAPEGGPRLDRASTLELTDVYLPALAESQHTVIVSNQPIKFFTGWTFLERYCQHSRLETDLKGFGQGEADNRRAFESWLQTTHCDSLVVIEVPKGSRYFEPVPQTGYEQLGEMLARQHVFIAGQEWYVPQSGFTVTLWSKSGSARR